MFLIFHSVSFVQAETIKTVNVCWESGLKPPYLMMKEGNKLTGIAVELLTKILSSNQIEMNNVVLPWKRCLLETQHGGMDIVPNASFNKKRTKFAHYSKPFYTTHLVLFFKSSRFLETPNISTVSELSQYSVGGVLGFNYSFYQGKLEIDTGSITREGLFTKLVNNRVDFALAQKEVIYSLNKVGQVDLRGIGEIPDLMKPIKVYHILVGKMHAHAPALLQLVDKGIDEIRKDGYYDVVMKKYGIPPEG